MGVSSLAYHTFVQVAMDCAGLLWPNLHESCTHASVHTHAHTHTHTQHTQKQEWCTS